MKKIFALIAVLFISTVVFSQVETSEITITSNQDGIVEFTWEPEGVVSYEYRLAIEQKGEVSRDSKFRIVDISLLSDEILVEGRKALFAYSTDKIINGGDNEFTVRDNSRFLLGAWETLVNEEDGSLNNGEYLLIIEGFDEDCNKEYESRVNFIISTDITTNVEMCENTFSSSKKIIGGVLYIEKEGVLYSISGIKR